jgi:anti-anti-sigma factor
VLRGEFNVASVPSFADTLAAWAAEHNGDVVVDLAGVEFIDASGLGALVRGRNLLRAGGRDLCVHSPSPFARQVMVLHSLGDPPEAALFSITAWATRAQVRHDVFDYIEVF